MTFPKPPKTPPRPRKRIPRGKRPNRQRKTTRAKIARECDKLWSLLVRRRGFCEICGATKGLQAAHGFSRRYRGTRWVLLNGFCLDAGCHVRMTYDPLLWDDFLKTQWGHDVYEELRHVAQHNGMPRDMDAILSKLREEGSRPGSGLSV